ncbi:MAG: hypothetical protein PHQ81_11085 [Methanofollis sp.]|nr:hypothetical protein [Methanofollis sp.]
MRVLFFVRRSDVLDQIVFARGQGGGTPRAQTLSSTYSSSPGAMPGLRRRATGNGLSV